MQIYLETECALFTYDENSYSIIITWKTPPLSVEFRDNVKTLLSVMEHFKTGKVVSDITNFGILHPDDQEWATSEWFKEAIKVGYSHQAIILPNDAYLQWVIEETGRPVMNTVTTAYFNNLEAAIKWIKQS
ncbi:hypothetical protein [Ohtaekwangia koreensis]|uniref:SpoIIAA-like n=1 Tax=Ohtaekwangia koreensis TaxID=688867 RepID=A0A1T5KN38_9BACT|nr:hypothetical protein [Ohtaekwangia koreensis]SKC65192.1 hypothetical protein SAMN05660236_2392 [Ohtaekwangia koreensis]